MRLFLLHRLEKEDDDVDEFFNDLQAVQIFAPSPAAAALEDILPLIDEGGDKREEVKFMRNEEEEEEGERTTTRYFEWRNI